MTSYLPCAFFRFCPAGLAGWLLLLSPAPSPAQPAPLTVPGLVAYWNFDELTGDLSRDGTGKWHGTNGLGALRQPGIIGAGSLLFTPLLPAHVDLGPDLSFNSSMTIEVLAIPLWSGLFMDYDEFLRKEDGNLRYLFSFQFDAFGDFADPTPYLGPVLSFGLNTGGGYRELELKLDGMEGRPTLDSLKDGQPHHFVAVYDSFSGFKGIYIDAELKASTFEPGAIQSGGVAAATIGNTAPYGNEPFTGHLDEFALWDRALTPREISHHYRSFKEGKNYFQPPTNLDLPNVVITAPASGSQHTAPAQITITATASDMDEIEKVEFFAGPDKLGESSAGSPFAFTWNHVASGTYSITARATDTLGGSKISEPVEITVKPIVLTAQWAQPVDAGSHRGFRVRTVQAPQFYPYPDLNRSSIQRAEAQLAENSDIPVESSGSENVFAINYNQENGGATGRFPADRLVPGLGSHDDDFSMEVVAYLHLPRGVHRLGIESDEGFQLRAGPGFASTPLKLAEFDGERAGGETFAEFEITEEGLYPFRIVWFESSGAAHLEWYRVDLTTGVRQLLNDDAATPVIKAYYQLNSGQPAVTLTHFRRDGTHFLFEFDRPGASSYEIEYNPSLVAEWRILENAAIEVNGERITVRDPASGTRFYRVKLF